ncbi:MAG: pyruvate carboxylase subunit B, partial [Gammaproteobacteria bacterium]|nr:pyruvate carboxylase subunit B [Gammaproteobacteria bacterium]
ESVITERPADNLKPEMKKLKKEIGDLAETEEDVLTFAMFADIGKSFLEQRKAGTLSPEPLEPPLEDNVAVCGTAPTEFNVTMHGESYNIKITGSGHRSQAQRPFYLTVDGVPEEILVETLSEIPTEPAGGGIGVSPAQLSGSGSRRPKATSPGHVTTSMPGVIVDVLVTEGGIVKAGDPVFITEAMKMETEVQAPISGKIKMIHISKGDTVNPDETLIEIEIE